MKTLGCVEWHPAKRQLWSGGNPEARFARTGDANEGGRRLRSKPGTLGFLLGKEGWLRLRQMIKNEPSQGVVFYSENRLFLPPARQQPGPKDL
jgi:hypothetical protein